MEIQQSSLYKNYIEQWGWTVFTVTDVNIFIKKIPFYGVMAKIQRPEHLPFIPQLVPFLQQHHVKRIIVEPTSDTDQKQFQLFMQSLSKFFTIHKEVFLPTKTILIDITKSEDAIFQSFAESKRRAVRRAQKNNIVIIESKSIDTLVKTKNRSAGFLGEITTSGIKNLWNIFSPKHAAILLAYHQSTESNPVGCILLLFYDDIAYYWIAGATHTGKKLFAPTLLVWEALKRSKKQGCKHFDFVGVFDERLPKVNTSWKGFTKFKEGFGGKELYYPITSMPHK